MSTCARIVGLLAVAGTTIGAVVLSSLLGINGSSAALATAAGVGCAWC